MASYRMSSTASAYRDRASESPQDASQLSSGEIMGWYHATIASESASLAAGGITGLNSFPGRLYRILSNPEHRDVVRWMDHGRAWKVLQPKVFESEVLPKYNAISKYPNFVRQVNAWGFCRVQKGRDKDCYFHEMFLRSRPHLVGRLKKPKGKQKKPNPADVPDFYALPWLPEEERGEVQPVSPVISTGASGSAAAPVATCGANLGASVGSDHSRSAFSGVVDPATIARNAAAAWGGIQQMPSTTKRQQQMQQPERGQERSVQQQMPSSQAQASGQPPVTTVNIQTTVNFNFNDQAQMRHFGGNMPTSPSGSSTIPHTVGSSSAGGSGALSVIVSGSRRGAAGPQALQQQEQATQQPMQPNMQLLQQMQIPQPAAAPSPTHGVSAAIQNTHPSGESDSPQLTQEQLDMFMRQNAEMMAKLSRQEPVTPSPPAPGTELSSLLFSSAVHGHQQRQPSLFVQGKSLEVGTLQHVPEACATENDREGGKPSGTVSGGSDEDKPNDCNRADQLEGEDQLLRFMNWFSSDDVSGKEEDSKKMNAPAVPLIEQVMPPYEWMPVLPNEYAVLANECGGMFILPFVAAWFGYDSVGVAVVWAGVICHTIVLSLTDFGPRTRGSRWTPINPVAHARFDWCLLFVQVAYMFIMHEHFGPTPYPAALFLLCMGGLDVWFGANTAFYNILNEPEQFVCYSTGRKQLVLRKGAYVHETEKGGSVPIKQETRSAGIMKGHSKTN